MNKFQYAQDVLHGNQMTESTPSSDAEFLVPLKYWNMTLRELDNALTAANERVTNAEARVKELEGEMHKIAFYVDTHYKGAGLPIAADWIIKELMSRAFERDDLDDKLEAAETKVKELGAENTALKHDITRTIQAASDQTTLATEALALAEVRGKALAFAKLVLEEDANADDQLPLQDLHDAIAQSEAAPSISPSSALDQVRADERERIIALGERRLTMTVQEYIEVIRALGWKSP